jgi:hypothetical protein
MKRDHDTYLVSHERLVLNLTAMYCAHLRRHVGGNFIGKTTEPRLRQRGHRGSSNMFEILKVAFSDF